MFNHFNGNVDPLAKSKKDAYANEQDDAANYGKGYPSVFQLKYVM